MVEKSKCLSFGYLTELIAVLAALQLYHLITLPVCAQSTDKVSVAKPNIIFIFTDDQQYDGYAANGNSLIKTPFLDKLAEHGVRFTQTHAALSLCSPSRAAVLTGRYGSANGVTRLAARLNNGEITFAQELKAAGYVTLFSGKWHLTESPEELGFDRSCSFYANGQYHNRPVNDEGKKHQPKEHIDLYCAKKSAAMIIETVREKKPFVLFHCTQLPHMDQTHAWPADAKYQALYSWSQMPLPDSWNDDLNMKPPYLRKVRNKTQALKYGYNKPDNIRKHVKDYYSVVSEMDSYLDVVLKAVRNSGIRDSTYLIFMSDNGWQLGDHGMSSKVLPYTASTRIPLVICGPGINKGVCSIPALNLDVTATIYDIAGITSEAVLHGRSLRPYLSGRKEDRTIVYECLGGYGGNDPILAAINERWLYIQTLGKETKYKVTFEEFYDKQSDPDEMNNLINSSKHNTVLDMLRKKITEHRKNILKEKNVRTHTQDPATTSVFGLSVKLSG